MDTEKTNYYEVLEIPIGASPQDIERAYVRAKNAYAGDSVAMYSLMSTSECEEILVLIEEAYSVLGFPEKRREYDRVRGFNSSSKSPFEEAINRPVSNTYTPPVEKNMNDNIFKDNALPAQDPSRPQFQYENYSSLNQEAKVSKVQALKKFGLDYEVDEAMELKIEQISEFAGSILKEIREYKNVSMERLVEMTRISRTQLLAIEADDITKLPADVYTRGFVSQVAKVLKLNPELVATSYLHHIKRIKGAK
jgi:curved DNA-binding protein CbpA